ncbi:hypothetical protein BGX38DRAFT_1091832 [Terfezia claveryi]|nr:hypothetical protein BGX38DRAFT_1091832 [Terfezia claveryi]
MKNTNLAEEESENHNDERVDVAESSLQWWSRERFTGAVLFNAASFLLPAIYGTLAKLWIAKIDPHMVVTTDVYTYIGVLVEVLNEGLPRVSYLIIGDKSSRSISSRVQLTNTLIVFQSMLGLIMSIVFVICAQQFANAFVPEPVRSASLTYVRIAAFSSLTSTLEVAVAYSTRALDKPDVPLLISGVKTAANIVLDMLFLSPFRVAKIKPTVNTQAAIRLICDALAAVCGLTYYLVRSRRHVTENCRANTSDAETGNSPTSLRPSIKALSILARPGFFTFIESAFRNVIYLWLVSGVVKMGETYATAWGIFNTIRWGLVMVPVQALEASASTFIGHHWGVWRKRVGIENHRAKATNKDLIYISRSAFISVLCVVVVEIPIFLLLTFLFIRPFAHYLSASDPVADVVQKMWRTVDWCYIIYGVSTQLSAILLATRPEMYWWKSFMSNLFWDLPWAIAVTKIGITPDTAWKWHGIIFGGSLVWNGFVTVAWIILWGWFLKRGKAIWGLTGTEWRPASL